MKFKYYLRGAGIGIIIGVIIMAVAFKLNSDSLSDAEVIKRAQELGYVKEDSGTLVDPTTENENALSDTEGEPSSDDTMTKPAKEDTPKDETKDDSKDSAKDDNESKPQESSKNDDSDSKADEKTDESENKPSADSDYVEFEILPGQFSDVVSNNLEKAGLVEDGESYNDYLIDNGYDSFIQPGSFTIPVGASESEIAQILMTKVENR